MILDGLLVGIGLTLGVLAIALPATLTVKATRALARTRPAWWLRTQLAIRRARPTHQEP